jgi:hypothetical protein
MKKALSLPGTRRGLCIGRNWTCAPLNAEKPWGQCRSEQTQHFELEARSNGATIQCSQYSRHACLRPAAWSAGVSYMQMWGIQANGLKCNSLCQPGTMDAERQQ